MRVRLLFAWTFATLGTVFPALADPPPEGFELHKFNASLQPVTEDGITTFRVIPDDCSDVDYGDGRGESDCKNGNVKSLIRHTRNARLGESVEYRFDVQIDPSFAYAGEYQPDSLPFRPAGWDSSLRIASWEGQFIKNFVYMLKADTTKGITFFGRQCQAPEKLGEWMSFSLKIRWANDQRGWVLATCDGAPVYVEEGASTTKQIQCYLANECQPGTVRDPDSFNYILGLAFNGYGHDWETNGLPSAFREMQADGFTMRMRNISVTKGIDLYGPDEKALVVALQTRLNELGCDVGSADGVPGRRTREQALICRDFSPAEMPDALNITTVGDFVALYSRPDAMDLPPGKLREPPPFVIHVAPTRLDPNSSADETIYEFFGVVDRAEAEPLPLSYLTIGQFDPANARYANFEILIQQDIGERAAEDLKACRGNRLDQWGDGSRHVVLQFDRSDTSYALNDAECLLKALPEAGSQEAAFLIDHFDDIATTLSTQGLTTAITDEGLRTFIERISSGELTVGRAEPPKISENIPEPKLALTIVPDQLELHGSDVVLPLAVDASGTGQGFDEVRFLVIGKYAAALENFFALEILFDERLAPATVDALGKCLQIRFDDWGGEEGRRAVFMLSKRGDHFVALGGKCGQAALGELGDKLAFIFANFSDVSIGLLKAGVPTIANGPDITPFFERAARGEVGLDLVLD
jgi:hypothetical protein